MPRYCSSFSGIKAGLPEPGPRPLPLKKSKESQKYSAISVILPMTSGYPPAKLACYSRSKYLEGYGYEKQNAPYYHRLCAFTCSVGTRIRAAGPRFSRANRQNYHLLHGRERQRAIASTAKTGLRHIHKRCKQVWASRYCPLALAQHPPHRIAPADIAGFAFVV